MLFQLSLPPPLTSVLKCIITLAFNILKNHKSATFISVANYSMNAKWWLISDIHKDNLIFVLALLSSSFPPMKLFPNNFFKMGI